MKICVLSEYFYPDDTGGTGTVLSKLMRQLKDDHVDVEIDVVTSRNLFRGAHNSLPENEEWEGIRIVRLPAPAASKNSVRRRLAANLMFTGAAFRKLLRMGKRYDLVLVVTAPPTLPLAARSFARLTNTPYVYLVYDLYLDLALALKLVKTDSQMVRSMQRVQKSWLRSSSKVIVLGRCMRDLVAERYDVALENIEVVPIPSSDLMIQPRGRDTEFRRANALGGFVVLYAGNFARYQDFDTLLDAAKLLRARSDITFVFVGDGTRRGHIAQRIENDGLHNVRLLPFVSEDQLSDMLASADASLVTLERGTAGLAVPSKFYNIMASGRATVAVIDPHSEVARVIEENDCGVCIEPENPQQLAQVLLDLTDDRERVEQLGRNARAACEAHYSLPHIANRFHSIFQTVTESHAPFNGGQKRRLRARLAAQVFKTGS